MTVALSLLRTGRDITEVYNRQVNTVYRICFSFMKNAADTEDIVQETFLKLMQSGATFEDEKKERAWLIITASNLCKNALKHWSRQSTDIDDCEVAVYDEPRESSELSRAILDLPSDYKTAVYLYYYEGYTTPEISKLLKIPQATVRTRLARARNLLKTKLGGEFDAERKYS